MNETRKSPNLTQDPHALRENREKNLEVAIGRQVRELRKRQRMTGSDLATQTGLSVGMLSKIENGMISPSLNTLQVLANALILGGGLRTAGSGHGAHTLKGLDLEPSEALQHPDLNFGRNRHHHLRVCGEDQVAHLGEAAGQELRVAEDLVAKREAQKNFFRPRRVFFSRQVGDGLAPVP